MAEPDKKRRRLCCGGGQSCIMDRRLCGDWVHEDILFKEAGLPVRKYCLTPLSKKQQEVMDEFLKGGTEDSPFQSITTRWNIDGDQESTNKL